jgi:internalin A
MTETELKELIDRAKAEQWEELDLSGLDLAVLPPEIGQLTQLQRLILGKVDEGTFESVGNQLTDLPSEIEGLTNLKLLSIFANKLTVIPEAIASLTSLQQLSLDRNQITVIPASIASLTSLQQLSLNSNQITVIPASIASLTSLKYLSLWDNQITMIPEAIASLTSLQRLDLDRNQITVIPEAIASLTSLQQLSLNSNQITVIPASIASLTSLKYLSLWDNQITMIPEAITSLTSLQQLSLNSNQITMIPEAIASLTSLQRLDLDRNQITMIPEAITSLTSLQRLSLNSNQITMIPEAITSLTSLQQLSLNSNQITMIPEAIRRLPKLEKLDLRNNPIGIPPEILAPAGQSWETPDAQPILDYYFTTRDPNKTHTLYEAKLLLVGEGSSGKTSLANKILDPDYQLEPATEDTSTQGIDILQWEFTGRNFKSYKINIWDFGGQEIYHQTHQFFLTERSLYLLVADSRKEDTDHYWWLQVVQLYSKDSPVLLIQNEKDKRTCNLDYKQLRGEFTNLGATYRIDLADNRGLAELKTDLKQQLEQLLTNGIPFPNKWFAVRYALENDRRNYIDCAEYEATCRTHGITDRSEMFKLSDFLHKLGVCLHFQRDPLLRHRVILKPNWGTIAVYKILDNKIVKQNLGRFCDADLCDIWQDHEYAEMHDQLLQLMKEFKVCYEIPRRKGEYIAPHLLSSDSPTYDLIDNGSAKILRFQYKRFMPKGILTRFIIEMHSDIENVSDPKSALVWKTGVVLQEHKSRAEVIEHYQQRDITIKIVGDRPRDFMTIVNRKLREIHEYFQIEPEDYETIIPCNCDVCAASPTPFEFTLDTLHKYLDRGKYSIECQASTNQVDVRGLIDNVLSVDRLDRKQDRYPDFGLEAQSLERSQLPFNLTINTSVKQESTMADDNKYTWTGDRVAGNKMQIGTVQGDAVAGDKTVNNYHQNLAESAKEIQALIDQLAKTYPTDTRAAKNGFADEIVKQIDTNPAITNRLLSATKAGGVAAIEQFLNHPAVSFIVAAIEDWEKTKNPNSAKP